MNILNLKRLKLKNLEIEPLNINHVKQFKNWGKHHKMFSDYDFYEETDEEIYQWYNWKCKDRNSYYAILLDDVAIGYVGFQFVNKFFKTSVLGIVLDGNYLDKGYGKEVLIGVINRYFEMGFKTLKLKVASYNKRAKHIYKNLGFKHRYTTLMTYEGDYFEFVGEYEKFKDDFIEIFYIKLFYVDNMILDKKTFYEVVKCFSN